MRHVQPNRDVPTSPRTCLRCGKSFPSTGPGNRICRHCAELNRKMCEGGIRLCEVTGPKVKYND